MTPEKGYTEMKDSGIEWIGEIPVHWNVRPLYCYFTERSNKNFALKEQNLLSLSYGKIIRKDINTNGGLLPASFNTYNIVEPNDIIVRPTDLQNDKRSLRTGLVNERGIITSAYIDLAPKAGVFAKFFHYLLHSYDIAKVFYNMGNGVRQGLNYSEFSRLLVLIPSASEQVAITDLLDSRCAEIDTLSADIQSEIDTLEEYKKSVITEAVTKGFNPTVEMKESGIEWAAKIPKHWKTMPNKYIMKKVKNICPKYDGEDILSLTMNGVIVRDLDAGGKMPASFDGYQILYPGNLLMCLFDYDVTPRCIGKINNNGLTSPAYSQFILKDGNSADYYYYYYLMIDFTKELLHLAKNLRHSFTEDQLGAIKAPVPPREEQVAIAAFLDKKCEEIEALISLKKQQLETLAEYKKSMIYEYVTGKRAV